MDNRTRLIIIVGENKSLHRSKPVIVYISGINIISHESTRGHVNLLT